MDGLTPDFFELLLTHRVQLTLQINDQLYGNITKLSTTLCSHRKGFAGHCWRSKKEMIHKFLFWDFKVRKRNRRGPCTTYIDKLEKETRIKREHLPNVMGNRCLWIRLIE